METQASNDVLGVIKKRMAWLNQRQAVLAENVANSDTPGYKARDLAAPSFQETLKKVGNVGLNTTKSNHIVPASMAGVNARTVKVDTGEGRINGNTVDLEQEMLKVSQTGIEYQQMTMFYKKIAGLFHIALKGQ